MSINHAGPAIALSVAAIGRAKFPGDSHSVSGAKDRRTCISATESFQRLGSLVAIIFTDASAEIIRRTWYGAIKTLENGKEENAVINDIFGEIVPNMDVEPIDPGCSCGCQCTTKTGASTTAGNAFDLGRG